MTLYEKRGRRYIPVAEYDAAALDALPEGFHLVHVEPGVRTWRLRIEPDQAPLIAALQEHRTDLSERIMAATRPRIRALSARERRAAAAWREVMGEEAILSLTAPSAQGILDELERILVERAGQT